MAYLRNRAEVPTCSMVPVPGSRRARSSFFCVCEKTVHRTGTCVVAGSRLVRVHSKAVGSTGELVHKRQVPVHSSWVELGRTNRRRQIAA